jgi:hypothetical protein
VASVNGWHGQRYVSGMVFAVITAIGTTALVGCDRDGRTTHPEAGTPCGGTEVTLADARAAAAFELIQPQAPLASTRNLESVWRCSTVAGGVLLLYDSGVGLLGSVNDLKDPPLEWQGLADSYKEFSIGEIDGIPASFADPSVDGAIGGVDFVVGDVRYMVSGNGSIPLWELVDVARSLPVES